MATSAGSPQIAVRARGSNKCPTHHGKEVMFYCKNCDKLVCPDCVIQECEGHKFAGISNITPTAKQKLQDFITKADLTEIPNIQERLQAADNDLAKNKNHFKDQIRKIRKQNEALKVELDKITETFVKAYQGMEQQNLDELLNYKKDLQTRIDKLASQLQDVKQSLQSGNDILLFDMSRVLQSKFDNLSTPICSTPEFTPGNISVQVLEQLLGKLNTNVQNQLSNLPGDWKLMSTFKPYQGYRVKSIHASVGRGQAWLSFYNVNTSKNAEKMLFTDQSGQVKQTLDTDVGVHDFRVSSNTGHIWYSSDQDNIIREVKGGESTVRFTTDATPQCICLTREDHVIIGHLTQVVKYTQDGQVICRTPHRNPTVVRTPLRISECPLTSNLAVVDIDMKEEGVNDKHVSILNDQLQLLHTNTGEVQGEQSPPKPFDPFDVCYTQAGEMVISDYYNRRLVLVSGTGRYIKTLYTNSTSPPRAVCVHRGDLWVSFVDESIQVLKNI